MSADIEIPPWATLADGERALKDINEVIAEFRKAHDRAIDAAVHRAWLGFFDKSFTATIEAVATFRQSIGVAMLVRERAEKLIEAIKARK